MHPARAGARTAGGDGFHPCEGERGPRLGALAEEAGGLRALRKRPIRSEGAFAAQKQDTGLAGSCGEAQKQRPHETSSGWSEGPCDAARRLFDCLCLLLRCSGDLLCQRGKKPRRRKGYRFPPQISAACAGAELADEHLHKNREEPGNAGSSLSMDRRSDATSLTPAPGTGR